MVPEDEKLPCKEDKDGHLKSCREKECPDPRFGSLTRIPKLN